MFEEPAPATAGFGPIARRWALATLLTLTGALAFGEPLARAALPLLAWGFGVVGPDFRLLRLEVVRVDGERRLAARVTLARTAVLGARVVLPDPRGHADAVTPLAHVLHLPVVAGIVALAWPAAGWREAALRGALVASGLVVLVPLDTPAVLAGEIRQLLIDVHAPGLADPLVAWSEFLGHGGRILLAGLLGAAATLGAHVAEAAIDRQGPGSHPRSGS